MKRPVIVSKVCAVVSRGFAARAREHEHRVFCGGCGLSRDCRDTSACPGTRWRCADCTAMEA